MGNGLENLQNMVIALEQNTITATKNTNPLNTGPEQHSSNYLGKINQKELSFIMPGRSAHWALRRTRGMVFHRGGPLLEDPLLPASRNAFQGGMWRLSLLRKGGGRNEAT